jgi:hypothetical protein
MGTTTTRTSDELIELNKQLENHYKYRMPYLLEYSDTKGEYRLVNRYFDLIDDFQGSVMDERDWPDFQQIQLYSDNTAPWKSRAMTVRYNNRLNLYRERIQTIRDILEDRYIAPENVRLLR